MTKEEAIKWITNLSDDIGAMRHQELWHYRQALDEIKDILECDYFADWIPCSERLPEVDKEVFVYIYNMPFIAWVDKNGEWNTETFTLDKELEKDDEPIEWMSLPHQLI